MNRRRLNIYLLDKDEIVHCFTTYSTNSIEDVIATRWAMFEDDPFYAGLKPWTRIVVRCTVTDAVRRGTRGT